MFEQLARYTMRYQESDLHLAFILLNLLTTSVLLLYFSSTSPTTTTLTSSSKVATDLDSDWIPRSEFRIPSQWHLLSRF